MSAFAVFKDGHNKLEGGIGDRRGAQGNGEQVAGVERLVSRSSKRAGIGRKCKTFIFVIYYTFKIHSKRELKILFDLHLASFETSGLISK